ncbi:hypothetical protein GOP47_0024204 [Adiantum capillus-veneris]|uniref:Uncharacterized protein n=1 Tax=Adiantum capillus-veneris TaxID=13818 RepID=A0A9D4U4Y9_ADICA|nr:hypothetical protein GOP47_0024204 [Adiantum capillus-veneris]
MLTKEECVNEEDWGFNDPVIDVDDESPILVVKAMARIQDIRGCVPAPVPLEEPTNEVLSVFALDDWMPQVGAMLLMDLLIKVVMQATLCRLLQVVFFKDGDAMEISLDNGWETQGVEAMQGVHVCFGCGDGPCI